MTDRRVFLKSFLAFFVLLFWSFATLLTGCNTTTIAEFVSAIGKDAADLAAYFNQSSIASQILSLASQIAVDITNFQSGSPAAAAVQAIQDLIQLIGTIPAVGPYIPLVDLLLSALSGLLLLLPQTSGASVPHNVHGHVVLPTHYPDASNKSMTKAKQQLDNTWKILTVKAPLTGTAPKAENNPGGLETPSDGDVHVRLVGIK